MGPARQAVIDLGPVIDPRSMAGLLLAPPRKDVPPPMATDVGL
jgi:hypothetical protein